MAVKKGVFEDYIKEREQANLSDILKERAQYTHNRVFDPLPTQKQKTNGKTVDKRNSEPNTNGRQTVDKRNSEPNTNDLQADKVEVISKITVDKRNSESDTIDRQTVDNVPPKGSLSKLCGAQRKIVIAIYKNCRINASKTTQELTLDHLLSLTGLKKSTIKTSIFRLKRKRYLFLVEYKDGRAGWSKYSLSKELFNDLLHHENGNLVLNNDLQTVDKRDSEPGSKPSTNSLSSSNNNIITTTTKNTDLPEEWSNINFSSLKEIGFSVTQLKQLYLQNTNVPEAVQESINHFAYGIKNNPNVERYVKDGKALNVLMGVLRKGMNWSEPKYESPKDKALRELMERKKLEKERREKIIDELITLEFDDWRESLEEDEIKVILPENVYKGTLDGAKITGLRNYYRNEILIPRLKKEGML